jgi:leucyl-tRNA synthetase
MAQYDFLRIEKRWQQYWKENHIFHTTNETTKPKYYILDMFPYPSGAGLHVGHPLGYISTGILAQYKRLKGFNVLRPMGFDSFGLPAEQYAILTGTHPAVTTEKNIQRYKEQLEMLGLGYDPQREIRTSDPEYYKWTQWIFLQLFHSWYNQDTDRAEPIEELVAHFQKQGNQGIKAATSHVGYFTADEWNGLETLVQENILMEYRLAYTAYTYVNWCEALGTVLANEEVKDGLSERGGHPVERRLMRQWQLRITAYAERLLKGLETVEWNPSLIEMQKNWIGKSEGAKIFFPIADSDKKLEIFTTRPDTIFGSTFMVIAPEHPLVGELTTSEQRQAVHDYVAAAMSRSERDRQSESKKATGVFTGSYALNPFTRTKIPIWIADYVLIGYGTGAIMAVPAHDERDYLFAKTFDLPIQSVIEGADVSTNAFPAKEGKMTNSEFLNGLEVKDAIRTAIQAVVDRGIGSAQTNYKLRDVTFSRQRYWGEPFPIVWKDGIARGVPESELPVTLPNVQSYKTTGTGESPLAAIDEWVNLPDGSRRETDTMPGWAGSSWYFFRYLDPNNPTKFVDPDLEKYWMPVDLYMGGSEHAVGHLLYARFWTKFLFDKGYVSVQEPFKKLINQGMILGRSSIIYKRKDADVFETMPLSEKEDRYIPIHADVRLVEDDALDIIGFKEWMKDYSDAEFILNSEGKFICDVEVEKMSKSLHNVVNPDDVCAQYGVDAFRMYEMFLGPIEQSKPWSTKGITGVFNFLRKFYSFFIGENDELLVTDEAPTAEELKILHQTIKKTEEDIERLSFNTTVAQFMICLNELSRLKCRKRAVLEPLLIVLCPFAPHITEELWERLGNQSSILQASFPQWKEEYLVESTFEYPISINGKMRLKIAFPLDCEPTEVEKQVLASEAVQKYLGENKVKKVVVVPGKIVNVVI